MYKLVCFDIDGVLTDGKVWVDETGRESKRLDFHDIDAIYRFHRDGYLLAAITGESTPITQYFEHRFPWKFFHRGVKDKQKVLREILASEGLSPSIVVYVGDGYADVPALQLAGLGVCPANAIVQAQAACDLILDRPGGSGAIAELYDRLQSL